MSEVTAIGIDLGTTYSCVGIWKNDTVEIIANDQGNRTTPSFVAFTETERLIGDAAKYQVSMNPENTVFDAKRLIGRKFADPAVQSDMKHWPFKVVSGQGDKPMIQIQYKGETKKFSAEEISAMVLSKMKETAEAYMGHKVKDAVITVPAYFNDAQRQATKNAGKIAGLNVLRIINEPTAAAIAYGLDNKINKENILVFDLGGGTFDVSLLTIENGVFEVKATAGDTHLGGEDFDNIFVDYMMEEFKKKHKKDMSVSNRAKVRLRTACERAKRTLSNNTQAYVDIESLFEGIDFTATVARAKFEDLCSEHFQNTLKPVQTVLDDAKMDKSEIHEVVLVGGSTRIPKIQQLVSEFFGGKALSKRINPDEAVAYGATVLAAKSNTGKNIPQLISLRLIDVTPLSLGIETKGGLMSVVIPRNTKIPCEMESSYTTAEDNQKAINFPVYEGERPLTRDNHLLGSFNLEEIPLKPLGEVSVMVKFSIDVDGILTVTAKETSQGSTNQIVISDTKSSLSSADIERMIKEAAHFATEDEDARQRVLARNKLEDFCLILQGKMSRLEVSARLKPFKQALESKSGEVVEWLAENQDAIKSKYETKLSELVEYSEPMLLQLYPRVVN